MRKFFLATLSFLLLLFLSSNTVVIAADEQVLTEKDKIVESTTQESTIQSTVEHQDSATFSSEITENEETKEVYGPQEKNVRVFEKGNEEVLDKGTDITVVDSEGRYVKGPRLSKQDQVLMLKYHGTDILKDTISWYYDAYYGKWLRSSEGNGAGYETDTDSLKIIGNDKFKYQVKNFGRMNGKDIHLWFQEATTYNIASSIPTLANYKQFPWHIYNKTYLVNKYRLWIEYEDGTRVENVKLLLPFKTSYAYSELRYKGLTFTSTNIEGIVVEESTIPLEKRKALYVPSKIPSLELKQDHGTNITFNFLVDAKYDFLITSNQYSVATGTEILGSNWGAENGAIDLFDQDIPILYPLYYPKPRVYQEICSSSTTAIGKFRIQQDLLKQNPFNYPDETNPLTVRIKISDVAGIKTPLEKIKVVTAENVDVTDQVKLQDNENGLLEISMWGEAIKAITGQGTTLTISGEFQPDTSSEKFLQSLNNADKYFHIPVEASNSDKGYSEVETNESLIEMPKPAATPIPQTVSVNTSTKDLNAGDLVKDLSTILLDDKVEIVGFKKDKIFDVIGQTDVIVVIKSVNTGIINEITVPVEVAGNLKFKTVPEKMDFLPVNISSGTKLINREDSEWQISIDNSLGAEWKAYAKAISAEDPLDENFKSSLVFKDSLGIDHELTGQQTLVAEGGKSERTPIIKCQENQGVLFKFDPGTMKVGRYDFSIEWNLETAP
ncbi:hypothetical protein ACPYMZ_00390 [Enterococcus faecium]|uniref:hypothetical protein n=1 Tax=Enterococcus faecium TaxID=1352 RepID=UPI0010FC09E6|nr:hypothetical protein [Enterococcus faecium]QCS45674.1 hypothetical protein FEF08_03185 [Enterococcus faecium]